MVQRKTLKPKEETKERMEEHRRKSESWDGFLHRAMDALESGEVLGARICSDCGEETAMYTITDGDLKCVECWERDSDE